MKYKDGKEIKLGDEVIIDSKYFGVVVADIDNSEYSESEPKEKWEYLKSGVIINTDFAGLVHYQEENLKEEEIELKVRN